MVSVHLATVRTQISNNLSLIYKIIKFVFLPIWYMITKSEFSGAKTLLHCSLVDFDKLVDSAY